jgi:hypothetical protein
MNNSSVDVIFASSQAERERAPAAADAAIFPGGPPPDEYLIGRSVCMRVTHITHSVACVRLCASECAHSPRAP